MQFVRVFGLAFVFWSVYFLGIIVAALAGTIIHPYVGLAAGLAVFVWGLVVRRRAHRRRWQPGVHSENAYAILGVRRDADLPAIRRAFRKLVQKYHPDGAPAQEKANATARFIRVSQAYELLSHEEKRFQYDGMIDDRDGEIPPFAEAYEQLKDEDKHPIYEIYDSLYNPERLTARFIEEDERSREAEREGRAFGEPSVREAPPETAAGEAAPAAEVDMPESVREALGALPTNVPPTVESPISRPPSSEIRPCAQCGRPCPASARLTGPVRCAKCIGFDTSLA
jgi:curved DNA-binding protein CbpA